MQSDRNIPGIRYNGFESSSSSPCCQLVCLGLVADSCAEYGSMAYAAVELYIAHMCAVNTCAL